MTRDSIEDSSFPEYDHKSSRSVQDLLKERASWHHVEHYVEQACQGW